MEVRIALTVNPVGNVKIVNMLFDDIITTDPDEVIPVSHLEFEFGIVFKSGTLPHIRTIPVHT